MSASFDGSATYLLRTGKVLRGPVADSGKGTLSCWLKTDDTTSALFMGGPDSTNPQVVLGLVSGTLRITIKDASTIVWRAVTSSTYNDSAWHHFIATWDLANTTAHLYVDGSADQTDSTGPDSGEAEWSTSTEWAIGGLANGTSLYDGKLYDLIFWPGQYVDISDDRNLQYFVSRDGQSVSVSDPFGAGQYIATEPGGVKPVGYGSHGTNPFGAAPAIYYAGSWRKNLGTGGKLTLQSEYEDTSSSDPDEPNAYRLASRPGAGRIGERWFDSEKSGMSAPRSETFIERRHGHPDYGKRLRTKDERDEETRDLLPPKQAFSTLLRPNEEDTLDNR